MSCRQVQSHLDDYILNQLDIGLFDQIENHLKECQDCQKQLEANRFLIQSLQSNKTPDPGDYYWQQMEDSILAKTTGKNRIESIPPNQNKVEPISIITRYLLPLAASFVLLFGSFVISDLVIGQNHSALLAENSMEISNESNSQIFTAIVAASPGSLGRQMVFANISGIGGGTR